MACRDKKNKFSKPIPEIGSFYHFWDDGKTSPSRHYVCKVERVIPKESAKNIIVEVPEWDFGTKETTMVKRTLYDHWELQVANHDWLYAEDTDYFVEASCPRYDENNLWFVRTKYDGWFSLDIQSSWQGGRLDIDYSIYKSVTADYKEWSKCSDEELLECYPLAIEENWEKNKSVCK